MAAAVVEVAVLQQQLLVLVRSTHFLLQRRALEQQLNVLSQEVGRLEQELDQALERGDTAMLQARVCARAAAFADTSCCCMC